VRSDDGRLRLGGADLAPIAQERALGTPTYVYDLDAIAAGAVELASAWGGAPHLIAYAVKANSAGPVVRALAGAGCGADVVSGAELSLALACGVSPDRVLFSGVAKTDGELDAAILAGPRGIAAVQIESVEEIARVSARAREASRRVRVSLRVNPAASLESLATHAHIATGHDEAKFGIATEDLADALALVGASPHLALAGLSTHVGSQLTTTGPYVAAARTLFELAASVRATSGRDLAFLDTGGGFGVDYGDGCDASPSDFVRETRALQATFGLSDLPLTIEPGRALVAAHGVLLSTVLQRKVTPYGAGVASRARRRWLMIDAGMNDLLRPALYQARHRVEVVAASGEASASRVAWRVVGPVCESSDDFGEHLLPVDCGEPGRVVAVLDAGAYGYTMASRYNGRPLPAEAFIEGGRVVASRPREGNAAWVGDRASVAGFG
ncbi:MAG: diaminopimelate decarboxylase, partial [Polyangiaceae bacterium]